METTYKKIAFGVLILASLIIYVYFNYLGGTSLMPSKPFLIMFAGIVIFFAGIQFITRYFKRRWSGIPEEVAIRESYIIKGGISSILVTVSHFFLGLWVPPYFVSPLYLLYVLFPALRKSVLTHAEMFLVVPGNLFWWIIVLLFWMIIGSFLGFILYKSRKARVSLRPFGNSGYIIVIFTSILIGICIFWIANLFKIP
jgi:hypothetical protein